MYISIYSRISYFFGIRRPEKINIEQINRNDNKRNLQLAFDLAESEFNVCKLLDPEGNETNNKNLCF